MVDVALQPVTAVDPANLDRSVRPADDFYRFANGTWLENNPIPDEHSRWGAFEQVDELSKAQVRAILEACAADVINSGDTAGDAKSGTQSIHRAIVGTLYATGMDEDAVEKAGLEPMRDVYDAIAAAETPADIAVLSAELQMRYGLPGAGFWVLTDSTDRKDSARCVAHVFQGGLGIGDRDFYLDEDKKEIRDQYVAHVARMLALTGMDPADADALASKLMALETRIAESCLTRTECRDPHKTYNKYAGPEELAASTESTAAPWARYFEAFGFVGNDFGGIVLDNPAYAKRMGEVIADESVDMDTWRAYLRYHATVAMAPFLNKAIVEEHFAFHVRVMSGQRELKPRWKRVAMSLGRCVEDSIGILYVEKHFSPEAKKVCKEMVESLTDVLRARINAVEWMSDETKRRAHAKLDRFRAKIGYPDVWDVDHCAAVAREVRTNTSYAANVRVACRAECSRWVKRINKPTDPHRWFMPPQMVNACFVPTRNEICFPSAILQPPFFIAPSADKPVGDPAVNFAAIGAVICHEISHGYDDKGRLYDENGELNDWWTEEDAAEYGRRSQRMVAQYARYKVFDKPVNGELCLGENVADLGGVKLAFIGFQRWMEENGRPADQDGFTPEQRFFLAWATVWRNNIRKEMALKRLVMDPHSPGEFRANGPLSVLPEFHKAFDVAEIDPMYVPEAERCEIW